MISPWVVRNAATFHEFTLSHNDATLLAGANCHRTYHGIDLGGWNLYCISKRATPDEGKQSARWRREGLRYTGRHVGRLAVVIPVRVMRTWDFWQPKRQVMFAESQARWATKDGVAAYYVLLPLAIACKRETPSTSDTSSSGGSLTAADTGSRSKAMPLQITSSAFQPGGSIPARYTCEGQDISPPLRALLGAAASALR